MNTIDYHLYDVVIMKKAHPCSAHSSEFQIVRLGADIRIKCLGCGNTILLTRESFNKKIKLVKEHHDSEIR